ncbi:MAG TPA: heavy metal translocating P-type ATPase, partial [Oscillospiraceae bacterium]|nr:heavy metal translocating P-type ATPase [Oscillospiraceae bacterium]
IKTVMDNVKNIINGLEPRVVVVEKDEIKKHDKNCCGCGHTDEIDKKTLIKLGIGAVLFVIALIFKMPDNIKFIFYFISYLVIGGEILQRAGKNILKGRVFDENFLMSIATIGAFAIGEFPEGVAVMLFYQIGELFQNLAVGRSRKSIAQLMDIRPDYANLRVGNSEKKVPPTEVAIGDYIIIKPGEKVPLDGTVIEGYSMLDTSALTGESVPREIEEGSTVLSGFININGLLVVEVTKEFAESTVSKILKLVESAGSKKAHTENFITKFARYYTPIIVSIAFALAVIPPLIISGANFSDWLYRALIFLVISCPCALVISIPLGVFGGIGGASRHGILIKGGNYLEALNNIDIAVFDKTGTLTEGIFKVTEINTNINIPKDELLKYAAYAESYSNHPIAVSILAAYGGEINKENIEDYNEILGHGIKAKIKGKEILAGNKKLMDMEKIVYKPVETIGTAVYIAMDGIFIGSIIVSDELKKDSKDTINKLRAIGIDRIIMLTGDSKNVGTEVAEKLTIDEVYSELLPNEKVKKIEILEKQKPSKGKLIFVGDGINDAPVIARADIGVAMGGLGSDAAIEAADVVLMTDEPMKLVSAIRIAKKTNRIVWQNITFSFVVKGIVLALGAGGIATMWGAVFADVGVALIAVLNAMRAMNVKGI